MAPKKNKSQKRRKRKLKGAQLEKLAFRLIWLGLAAFSIWLILSFTGPKLYKMAQIRGWISGATLQQEIVTDKAQTKSLNTSSNRYEDKYSYSYLIAWSNQPASEPGPDRVNLIFSDWERIAVGDTVNLIRIPNDEKAYLREGIFASNGNFGFDLGLIIAELALAITAVTMIFKK